GRCYEAQKNYGEAERLYREAIAEAPTSVEGYVRLAWLLRGSLDQAAEADLIIAQMVADNQDTLQAYLDRAAYLQRVHGSLAGAAADLHKALALDPERKDPRVLLLAGEVAWEQERQGRPALAGGTAGLLAPAGPGPLRAAAALYPGRAGQARRYLE